MKKQQPLSLIIIILVVICLLCCAAAVGIALISWIFTANSSAALLPPPSAASITPTLVMELPTPEPTVILPSPRPEEPPESPVPVPPPLSAPLPVPNPLTETLNTFETSPVPISDPIALAERLEGKQDLPVSLQFPLRSYQTGDRESFWVNNSATNEYFQVNAALAYQTDHVYFWIEDGTDYRERDLKALVDTFENEIYPTNREFFGSEWTPGVDADPHLYILYTSNLGGAVAGYFSSIDEYLPLVREYSNTHEMFVLDAEHVDLGEEFAYSVLAHEFQHMIHWNIDRNEETWMNEGASDLAAFINGYSIGGHDRVFAQSPDTQLNVWGESAGSSTENYGASFLFMTYILDRFGRDFTKALIANPAEGLQSIDDLLEAQAIKDPLSGAQIAADDLYLDWLITNFLQDERVADGRYTYHNYPAAPEFSPTEKITDCPEQLESQTVHQYGVNYIQIRCEGSYTIHFDSSEQVPVLPIDPHSGVYAFFSNRGDESDMVLTRTFDFKDTSGPLTLAYWTWYDLETDYDYLYLSASLDGESWQILSTPSGTPDDPTGNNYGWGYNGKSGGEPEWILEKVDLSQFAGKEVQLRFEYITDAAINGEGLLLDDVAVPEINYFSDFEKDDGGWQSEGFVRIRNILPQSFRLALIQGGRNPSVEILAIGPDNRLEIPIEIGGSVPNVVLVVTGTTRFTRQEALYNLSVQPR